MTTTTRIENNFLALESMMLRLFPTDNRSFYLIKNRFIEKEEAMLILSFKEWDV